MLGLLYLRQVDRVFDYAYYSYSRGKRSGSLQCVPETSRASRIFQVAGRDESIMTCKKVGVELRTSKLRLVTGRERTTEQRLIYETMCHLCQVACICVEYNMTTLMLIIMGIGYRKT